MQNRVFVVTGASRGVGLAIAKKVLEEGSSVVINGRSEESLTEALEVLNGGDRCLAVPGSVASEEHVIELFEKAKERFGTVDCLVNNAGTALLATVTETSLQDWNDQLAVHATGTFLASRQVLKLWKELKKSGSIVNISSVSGKVGSQLATAYSAAKAAVLGFTKALAKEVAPAGVRVNAICPGAVETKLFMEDTLGVMAQRFSSTTDALLKGTLSAIPLKRLLSPDEVAELALYLCSDKAMGITGQTFTISCGFDIH